jgi:hypothetical protein
VVRTPKRVKRGAYLLPSRQIQVQFSGSQFALGSHPQGAKSSANQQWQRDLTNTVDAN